MGLWSYPAQNFALYHLGMVPGVWVFMGVRQFFLFCFFPFNFRKSKMEKNMNIQDEHGLISVSGALDPRKMIS